MAKRRSVGISVPELPLEISYPKLPGNISQRPGARSRQSPLTTTQLAADVHRRDLSSISQLSVAKAPKACDEESPATISKAPHPPSRGVRQANSKPKPSPKTNKGNGGPTREVTPLKINLKGAYPTLPRLRNDAPNSISRQGILSRPTKLRKTVKNVTWASDVPRTAELLPKQAPNLRLRKVKNAKKWEPPTPGVASRTRAAAAAEAEKHAEWEQTTAADMRNSIASAGRASRWKSKTKGTK